MSDHDPPPSSTDPLPSPAPPVNLETQPFWDATAEGRFLLLRCDACELVIWYPRSLCPDCHGTATTWFEASGRGTVYSWSVVRKGQGPWAGAAPYITAFVTLDEGPTVLTNIVGCSPDEVSIGQAVEVVWHDTGEGSSLYRFTPCG